MQNTEKNTKIFDKISAILSQEFGSIGLKELRELSICYDTLRQARAEKRDEGNAIYQEIKEKESKMILLLKDNKDENGKKLYTESSIESIVALDPIVSDLSRDHNKIKFISDTIEGKIKSLEVIMTTLRMNLKKEGPSFSDVTSQSLPDEMPF